MTRRGSASREKPVWPSTSTNFYIGIYFHFLYFFVYFITYKYTWVPKSLRKIQQKSPSGRGAVSLASRMLLRRLSLKALCAVKVWLHFFLRELGWVMGWLLAAFRRGRGCICSSLQRNLPGWGAEGGAEVSRRSLERRAAQPCHPGGKRMRLMRGRSSPPTIRRGVALVCLGAEAGFRSRVGVGCGVRVM